MKLFFSSLAFLVSSAYGWGHPMEGGFDIVMKGGDTITEMDQVDFPTYRNGKCTVRFPRDGNWATQNGFNTGGWDANQNSFCAPYDGSVEAKYTLQKDGNFVARCGTVLDYTTHTGQGYPEADYMLVIDDDCILHIWKGTMDCTSVNIEQEIWTNVKKAPFMNGDRLGKGEYVYDEEAGTKLIMQSSDGNLVLYDAYDSSNVLWAANEEWGPGPLPVFHEHYAVVSHNGHLNLVGIHYGDNMSETVYYSKPLKNYSTETGCYTVEYDPAEDDLVAVQCWD